MDIIESIKIFTFILSSIIFVSITRVCLNFTDPNICNSVSFKEYIKGRFRYIKSIVWPIVIVVIIFMLYLIVLSMTKIN